MRVPTCLCQHVLQNKLIRPFQLLLLLKLYSDGVISLSNSVKIQLSEHLSISVRSIEINLNILIDLNWVGYRRINKKIYIRSFNTIMLDCKKKSYMAAEFTVEYLSSIRAYLTAAVIGRLGQVQKWKQTGENRAGARKKGRAFQSAFSPIVSNIALSKILNISCSTAFLWKKDAECSGYITIKKRFESLGIRKKEVGHYKKYNPDNANRVIVIKNSAYLQNSDIVWSNLHLKKRRKSKHIVGIYKGRFI